MIKYLYWFFVLFLVVYRRVFGLFLIWIAIPFRATLRSIVYNYHLQNGIILKRLQERDPIKVEDGWTLYNGHGSETGVVKYRYVNKLMYYPSLFLWLWLDDDSNHDTFDKGFNQTIIDGERKTWMPDYVKSKLQEDNMMADNSDKIIFGNTFDLGDKRGKHPLRGFWSVLLWTIRNTGYNHNYKFNQITDENKTFQVVVFGRMFGWKDDGYVISNGKKLNAYSWECGRKI